MEHRSGWAYGECIGGREWLTIMGSAHRRPVLHSTREEAQRALDSEPYRNSPHLSLEIVHVAEIWHGGVSGGYAYRITPAPATSAVTTARQELTATHDALEEAVTVGAGNGTLNDLAQAVADAEARLSAARGAREMVGS